MPETTVRTVIWTGDAPTQTGLLRQYWLSSRHPGTGTVFVEGSERGKRSESGSKSLTSVSICHPDLRERVWNFLFAFFIESATAPPPPPPVINPRPNTLVLSVPVVSKNMTRRSLSIWSGIFPGYRHWCCAPPAKSTRCLGLSTFRNSLHSVRDVALTKVGLGPSTKTPPGILVRFSGIRTELLYWQCY